MLRNIISTSLGIHEDSPEVKDRPRYPLYTVEIVLGKG